MKDLMEKVINLSDEQLEIYIKETRELLEDKSFNSQERELLEAFLYFLQKGEKCKQYLADFRFNWRGFIREVKKLKDLERDMGADYREVKKN